jgi:DNA mismatch endonuclease (patch repair protein)
MDTLTPAQRSERMRRVRSNGNRSTEWRLRSALMRCSVVGWRLHDTDLPGHPDFFFPARSLAVFIDGCFWHGCPFCKRPLPRDNYAYWAAKIKGNVKRADVVNRELRRMGYRVLRIWEHELASPKGIEKSLRAIERTTARRRRG